MLIHVSEGGLGWSWTGQHTPDHGLWLVRSEYGHIMATPNETFHKKLTNVYLWFPYRNRCMYLRSFPTYTCTYNGLLLIKDRLAYTHGCQTLHTYSSKYVLQEYETHWCFAVMIVCVYIDASKYFQQVVRKCDGYFKCLYKIISNG